MPPPAPLAGGCKRCVDGNLPACCAAWEEIGLWGSALLPCTFGASWIVALQVVASPAFLDFGVLALWLSCSVMALISASNSESLPAPSEAAGENSPLRVRNVSSPPSGVLKTASGVLGGLWPPPATGCSG